MTAQETKKQIEQALHAFTTPRLKENALALWEQLGYTSDKQLDLEPNNAEGFLDAFQLHSSLNADRAMLDRWQTVEFLFQLTQDEIDQSPQLSMFSTEQIDDTIIESYLFLAIELEAAHYTRTDLARMTREVNKQFQMPVLILFKYGPLLTFSVINRRLHKRDSSKDVLEKVTLIKDIRIDQTHRAHLEILFDLSLPELYRNYGFRNFVELHRTWQKTLDSSELNKRFFQEIANWYFWAEQEITFPVVTTASTDSTATDAELDKQRAMNLIRLLTRLIFVWFLKEKGLIPDDLFNPQKLNNLLLYEDRNDSTYYKAILQNLFFATLNQEMNTPPKPDNRKFRGTAKKAGQRDQNYMAHNVYRYERYFQAPQAALDLFADIPFLNGGLFECLDKADPEQPKQAIRIDGFSDRDDNPLQVPDFLFFDKNHEIDLNAIYGTSKRRYQVRGLIDILSSYKFTVTENTPIEEEVALDPELLGRVFENLLAAYNEETQTTARKQTGSFYTPREVVDYMVDEALLSYLEGQLQTGLQNHSNDADERPTLTARLQHLLAYNDEAPQFTPAEINRLIAAIDAIKILDPACGSGAFPMGILQKLVFILGKLDPDNALWKEKQLAKLDDVVMQAELERVFRENYNDYGRKLYLIENCIYGVDIQPIAVQIAKLRFFISLVVDQRIDDQAGNRGIRPLPNLETKFVAANSLLSVERPLQLGLISSDERVITKRAELKDVRHRYFSARTTKTKEKYRQRDQALREELSDLLQNNGFPPEAAHQLTHWDPYNPNVSADFFDPEWMFTFAEGDGFDVVIGNPPYVRQEKLRDLKPALQSYRCYTGTADLYVYFFERGFRALKQGGTLSFIVSNKYFRAGYGKKLRAFLSEQSTIRRLIDFGDAPVFTAIAYPSIIVLAKAPSQGNQVHVLTWEPGPPISDFPEIVATESFALPQDKLTADSWRLEPPRVLRLLEQLRRSGLPLGEFISERFYRGILTGFNKAFIVEQAERDKLIAGHASSEELIKPILRGSDVKRWSTKSDGQYLIRIESSENKKHPWSGQPADVAEEIFAQTYPAIYKWLKGYQKELNKRWDKGHYYWELRACAYWKEFKQPKILYQEIATYQAFAWDETGIYTNNKTFLIPGADYYLLALLNSNVVWFFLDKVASKLQGGAFALQTPYVSQVPIPQVLVDHRTVLQMLVAYILYLKKYSEQPINPHVPNDHIITLLEELLNGCVFELYFTQEVHAQGVNVIDLVHEQFRPLPDVAAEEDHPTVRVIIEQGYQVLRASQGEIRNRLIKQKIVVPEIKLIVESLAQ